jgi:hypothetical protein
MFRNSVFPPRLFVPKGHRENSPAFQRREPCQKSPSPAGTADLTGGRGENGGGIISPQIQRRPQMGEPEGWSHEGAKKRELKKSFRDFWGQAVATPIGAGTACLGATRRNLPHMPSFRGSMHEPGLGLLKVLRCCFLVVGSVRRGRRTLHARARVFPIWESKSQPSLRDWFVACSGPGVETPGYSHPVPPGRKFRAFLRGIEVFERVIHSPQTRNPPNPHFYDFC